MPMMLLVSTYYLLYYLNIFGKTFLAITSRSYQCPTAIFGHNTVNFRQWEESMYYSCKLYVSVVTEILRFSNF